MKDNNSKFRNQYKRIKLLINEDDWSNADKICECVLAEDCEDGIIYLYKLFIDYKVKSLSDLIDVSDNIKENNNYKFFIKYGDQKEVEGLKKLEKEKEKKEKIDSDAKQFKKALSLIKVSEKYGFKKKKKICIQAKNILSNIEPNDTTINNIEYCEKTIERCDKYFNDKKKLL